MHHVSSKNNMCDIQVFSVSGEWPQPACDRDAIPGAPQGPSWDTSGRQH